MVRTFAVFAFGLLAGVVLGFQYSRSSPDEERVRLNAEVMPANPADVALGIGSPPVLASAPRAAPASSVEQLKEQLRMQSGAMTNPHRRQELEDLLLLLGGRDSLAAADTALALELEPALQARALARLALDDAGAALERLGAMDDPLVVRVSAVALFRALGQDADALERVLAALPGHVAERIVRMDVHEELASIAPDLALAMALAEPVPATQGDLLRRVAFSWGARAPREALARTGRIEDPVLAEAFEMNVMGTWALSDPAAVIEHLEERFANGRSVSVSDAGILAVAAHVRPELVFSYARDHPSEPMDTVARRVLVDWAGRDPGAALDAWDAAGGARAFPMILEAVFEAAGATDPGLALERARALGDARDRELGVAAAISGMRDVDAVFAALGGLDDERLRGDALRGFVRQAAFRPGARRIADRLVAMGGEQELGALQMILSGWVRTDPEALLAWHALNPEVSRGDWFGNALGAVAAQTPGRAIGTIDTLPAGERGSAFAAMLASLADRNMDAALAGLERWSGREGHDDAVGAVASVLGFARPGEALAMLSREGLLAADRGLLGRLALSWAAHDPEAAMPWLDRLSEDEVRELAIEQGLSGFAGQDPEGARTWVSDHMSGIERDRHFAELARQAASRGGPDEIFVEAIQDPGIRQKLLMELGRGPWGGG